MVIGLDASRANQAERTGTEWYAWHIIWRLPGLFPEHRFRLYVRESLRDDLQPLAPNVEVRVLHWPPGILWSHLRLSWELLWHRPDALFVPSDTVPLVHPRRTMTTIHDVAFERFPELYRGQSVQRRLGWLRPIIHLLVRLVTLGRYSASERDYHRWSARQAVRSCPTILTVSEFSKREIIDTLGADPDRIGVTHLGVTQADVFTDLSPESMRATLKLLGITRPFLLYFGRLEYKKNIDGLVSAYRVYRQHATDPVDMVLAGQPGYGWEMVAPTITDLLSQGVIHQLGWIGQSEKLALQHSAAACVFVSRYEGFGLPPLESMSAGVPVIASRAGSLPEVLDSAAEFVPMDDTPAIAQAFTRITSDQTRRAELIAAGSAWVKQFTWDRTAEQTAAYLRQLLSLPKSS